MRFNITLETIRYSKVIILRPEDNTRLFNLCGKLDEHLHLIEHSLKVNIKQRSYTFYISGDPQEVQQAAKLLTDLYKSTKTGIALKPNDIHLHLQAIRSQPLSNTAPTQNKLMELRLKRCAINARGENQVHYLRSIEKHDINFGIGPAGTGKTYLAVACAVSALEMGRVSRIVLVRPIVEAGEKLGFLPGDIAQKVHPYLQPLYDALYEMIGFDQVGQMIERGLIELAPLAYMRGRSLNDSFIILDEGQNTTQEQMKMFLTRLGFNSKAVITGDVTQIDLNSHQRSGLVHTLEVLNGVEGISFTQFSAADVVRHPLVQSVVEAYEQYNQLNKKLKL
jgi:phosphate starvation-inducible PhoH-like protein